MSYCFQRDPDIGLFFDVDGTLSNSYRLGFDSTNAVLQQHGINPVSEEEYHEGTKYTTPMRLAWHVTGDPLNPIGKELGEEFDGLYVKLVSPQTASLYEGIFDMIQHFRQNSDVIKFAALSNACTEYVTAVLKVNALQELFPVALGADQVPAPKPAPDGLLSIAQQLQIRPGRCVYVGDSPSDGQAAAAAGMHSIGVTWGSHAKEKVIPAFVVTVDTVEDLKFELLQFVKKCLLNYA